LMSAIRSALDRYGDRERWEELQRRGMARDFSWKRSARQYLEVYRKVGERKQKL